MSTHSQQIQDLNEELDIALTFLDHYESKVKRQQSQLTLLESKLQARNKVIARLVERLEALETSAEQADDLAQPPLALREAFASLRLDVE